MSNASSSRITGRSNSTATNSTANGYVRRKRETSKSVGPPHNDKTISRKFIKDDEPESEDDERQGDGMLSLRPDPSSNRSSSSTTTVKKQQLKGTKRKIAEVQSTNSSVNNASRRRGGTVDVEANDDERDLVIPHVVLSSRPKKKRKIVVELIRKPENSPEPTYSRSRGQGKKSSLSRVQQNWVREKGKKKGIDSTDEDVDEESVVGHNTKPVNEDEMEEQMVEEVLSEGIPSPPTSAKGNERSIQDPNINVSLNDYQTAADGSELENAQVHVGDIEEGPQVEQIIHRATKGKERASASPSSRRKLRSVQRVEKRFKETLIPDVTVLELTDSSLDGIEHDPNNELDLAGTPAPAPLEGNLQTRSTEDRPGSYAGDKYVIDVEVEGIESSSRLSPGAKRRLEIFDIEVMGKRTSKGGVQLSPTPRHPTTKLATNSNPKRVTPMTEAGLPTTNTGNSGPSVPQPNVYAYLGDIVPESDVENSQSQEREIQLPMPYTTNPQPVFEAGTFLTPVTPPSSPSKVTLKSRMKQRTPVSSSKAVQNNHSGSSIQSNSYADYPSNKLLRPLPRLSPSTFHAHLQPPDSSLPDSIIEPSSSNDRQVQEGIEEFESPEKERHGNKKVVVLDKRARQWDTAAEENDGVAELDTSRPKGKERAEDSEDSDFFRRGKKIAEEAEAKKKRDSTVSVANPGREETTQKKQSLRDIAARAEARIRSLDFVSRSSAAEDEQPEDEAAVADASTTVVPPASGPHTMSQEQSSQAQQEDAVFRVMEEAYVNPSSFLMEEDETHDGNDSASAALQSRFLRQEEEESTQELLKDMLQLQAQQRQMDVTDSNTSQDLGLISQNKTNDVDTSSLGSAQV